MKEFMKKNFGPSWPWVLAYLSALALLYLYWMVNVPMAHAPDEEVRVILSDYVWRNGSLPNAWEPSVRIWNWGFSYALRPMLVNIIGAGFMAVTSLFTTDLWALVLSVRLVSVISGVLMAMYCFKIGLALGWQTRWTWAFACICSLMPQIAFLSSYNNNDIFAAFCTTMIVYYWLQGLKSHWNWKSCIALGIVLGLTCLSYYNAYPFILFSVVIFFASQVHRHMDGKEWKVLFAKAGVIAFIAFLLAGWWFIRNMILYDGDMLGTKTRIQMGLMYASEELKPGILNNPKHAGESLMHMLFSTERFGENWLSFTYKSSIGYLGAMEYQLPGIIYGVFFWFLVIGFAAFWIGWLIRLCQRTSSRKPSFKKDQLVFTLCLAASILLVIALSMYYSWSDDYSPQGRYLVPAFSAVILLVTAGWRWIAEFIGYLIHSRMLFARLICTVLCLCMAGLQVYSLSAIILPNFSSEPRLPEKYAAQSWLHQQ